MTPDYSWIDVDYLGVSGRTIARILTGSARLDLERPPGDRDDLGRCVRLLDAAEAAGHNWRSRLDEVAAVHPEWAPIVAAWADLEAAYARDLEAREAWRVRRWTRADGGRRKWPVYAPEPASEVYAMLCAMRAR